ncbi:protein phosphatase 1 regulatory subunit 12A isoform X2 [Glossina fuscipes]|uniref:Protein phosphatase 1 regulatory subunit 12B n=1 Tax=Glossina fuscipes TaxID=7396 RepID=A0A9C6E2C0_9MUSC|nr:protein phosphatase 1 regulatory subunit 12A isoform X2 [Glossina fuscipes]
MTSLDVRNNSAVMKRAEQLKRWEESDTNHQPATPRPERGNRIKFSSGCIFLAACLSGDKDEVLKMLEQGADINTSNVDGLTALHQACIDDNLEMVEFLVEHGADINRQDNEGWTPLHATASCGFVSIARYLVEHGADVAAVNSDGDLAVDLAVDIQHVPMIDFMQKMVAEQQIDCTKARQAEEQQMLSDAKRWLRSDASEVNRPHPKTGATALHVAAAKGYTKVLSLLLAGRANVDAQDNDGWTPLHAAAHWGQKEAAEMLVDAMGDMDVRNYAGQTCIDVADRKMVKFLEELRPNNKRIKRRPSSQIRISDTIESHIDKASAKIIRVEVRPENNKDHANASSSLASASVTTTTTTTTTITGHNLTTNSESEETDSELTDSTESSHSTSLSDNQDNQEDEKSTNEIPAADDETPWRRSNNVPRGRTLNESSSKIQVPDRDVNKTTTTNNSSDTSDIILRRTQSFENDEKKSPPLSPTTTPPTSNALSTTSSIHTTPTTTTTSNAPAIVNTTLIRSALNNQVNHETTNSPQNEKDINVKRSNHQNLKNQHNNIAGVDTIAVDATVKEAKQTTGNIIKNFFKSFVPPVRDEESETQRKAHAKRVRETRRSTQGVTLDEIKSAEELVKKKNSAMNNNNNNNNNNTSSSNNDTQASKTSNNIPINSDSDTLAITEEQSSKASSPKMLTKYECDAVNQKSSEDDDVEITASFTLMATSSGKLRSLPNVAGIDNKDVNEIEISSTEDEGDGGDKEVSATFIMAPRKTSRTPTPTPTPTPTESHETTVVVPPPHQRNRLYSRSSSVSDDESNAKENRRRRLRSIKHNKENDNKKTESPSPPPPAEGMRKPSTPTRQLNLQRLHSANERVRSAFFNPLPLSTQHTSTATLTSPTTTLSGQYVPSPTLGSPVRLREKRPYFDTDNTNNTITLAEKLRNEANKYNENNEKRNDVTTSLPSTGNNESNELSTTSSSIFGPVIGVGPVTGVGYNYTSRRSLDSSSLPSSPLHTRERESGGNDFSNVGSREISSAGFYPAERRPSWRMKFDTGSKFKLEDASSGNSSYPPNNSIIIPSAPAVIAAANLSSTAMSQRRTSGGMNPNISSSANQSIHTIGRPVSAPPNSTITNSSIATLTSASATSSHTEADTSSTGSFMPRRVSASTSTTALVPETCTVSTTTTNSVATTTSGISSANDDRDNDKENDSRSALATQAVIQRRRKPKRRSTGVVHIDMDDLDPERQDDDAEDRESGGESRQPSRSRLAGLTSSITPSASSNSASDEKKANDRSESVDNIDYKALWEAVKMENEKLKQQLKKKDEEITQTRATLERLANATTKNSLSEIEKRERRTMERKLSELEEELKQLEVYKTENLRLKEENAALIRVISKLSK